jgi:hypothetical protein
MPKDTHEEIKDAPGAALAAPEAPRPSRDGTGVDLEQAILHELDEAAQDAYTVYSDKLYEHGELQATQWAGLNEALRSAWRAAVKHVREQEVIANA